MPTRELERLILSGKAVIDNNEINRFCFRNVTLKSDHNGNVKPNKAIDKKKIDGVIAII
jgi:phage terminase large subunit-like protein